LSTILHIIHNIALVIKLFFVKALTPRLFDLY
jgi:hypothetical protein